MKVCVFRYCFPIMLVCVLTNTDASSKSSQCFGLKMATDYNRIVDLLTTARLTRTVSTSLFTPSRHDLSNFWKFIDRDSKSANFFKNGSPSFSGRLMGLVQKCETVASPTPTVTIPGGAITEQVIPMSKMMIAQTMQPDPEQLLEIEQSTRSNFKTFVAEHSIRLTADLFGYICLSQPTEALHIWMTSPRSYPDRTHTQEVLSALFERTNMQIEESGLKVDETRGYLAAAPDGIVVGRSALVKLHVLQRPRRNKKHYTWDAATELSQKKPLYYEIQGLLAIVGVDECILVIVSRDFMKQTIVKRDEDFWERNMLQKIDDFAMNTLMPRLSQNLPNFRYIQAAVKLIDMATRTLANTDFLEVFTKTQLTHKEKSFEILMTHSRIRLLTKNFYVVMDNKIPIKQRVREVLESYYKLKSEWVFERNLKMIFITRYANAEGLIFEKGGLVIDRTHRFLATDLTAYIGKKRESSDQGTRLRPPYIIFEVVLPVVSYISRDSPKEIILKELNFMQATEKENAEGEIEVSYSLKKDSKYYYKIQGSLAITRAKECIFIIGLPGRSDSYSEKIQYDMDLWNDMLEKLNDFYYKAYLVYHASPEYFDVAFKGKSLADLRRWPTDPPKEENFKPNFSYWFNKILSSVIKKN